MTDRKLIFDLGLHNGMDSDYYLRKGFQVVALEANPKLAAGARAQFKSYIDRGDFTVVDKALWSADGYSIDFFVNTEKDDWSSALEVWASKGGHALEKISVDTVTLPSLFDAHGTPYYIKCDIEGADDLFLDQLLADDRMPDFVSVEAADLTMLAKLAAKGYDCFQVVNQATLWAVEQPKPSLEGDYAEVAFNGHMSGPFGFDLPAPRWRNFAETCNAYNKFMELHALDSLLAIGWLDFHAGKRSVLFPGA